jgi:hypothetical protein
MAESRTFIPVKLYRRCLTVLSDRREKTFEIKGLELKKSQTVISQVPGFQLVAFFVHRTIAIVVVAVHSYCQSVVPSPQAACGW